MNEPENGSPRESSTAGPTASECSVENPITNGADASTPWPPEDMFCLNELSVLKKIRTRNGEWLGVYEGFSPGFCQGSGFQELLCASRSPAVLYRSLKRLAVAFPIIVRRAPSKEHVLQHLEPAKPSRVTQLRRSAFEAVGEARRMLDPDDFTFPLVRLKAYDWFVYELMSFDHLIEQPEAKALSEAFSTLCVTLLKIEERAQNWNHMQRHDYSNLSKEFGDALRSEREKSRYRVSSVEAQHRIDKFLADSTEAVTKQFEAMRQAADFLRDLSNMARSKGGKVGDRATGKETLKVLTVLRDLAANIPLKAIAQVEIDGQVDDAKSLKKYKSLERMVSRFSKRLAKAVHHQYGPRITSLGYNHLFHALRDWPWIDSVRDKAALMEAARRGLPDLRLA